MEFEKESPFKIVTFFILFLIFFGKDGQVCTKGKDISWWKRCINVVILEQKGNIAKCIEGSEILDPSWDKTCSSLQTIS